MQKVKNCVRGMRQTWGSATTKKEMWDKEYAGGRWNHCDHTPDAFIYGYVYRYCQNGSVLDLGCGSGNTGNEMNVARYGDYTGVDVSEVAVGKAAARSAVTGRAQKNRYLQGDILTYAPCQKHDVILFRESIYYLPLVKIKSELDRYSTYLTAKGVFIVHVSGTKPEKGQKILAIIHNGFSVLEHESPNKAGDYVVVFSSSRVSVPSPAKQRTN